MEKLFIKISIKILSVIIYTIFLGILLPLFVAFSTAVYSFFEDAFLNWDKLYLGIKYLVFLVAVLLVLCFIFMLFSFLAYIFRTKPKPPKE